MEMKYIQTTFFRARPRYISHEPTVSSAVYRTAGNFDNPSRTTISKVETAKIQYIDAHGNARGVTRPSTRSNRLPGSPGFRGSKQDTSRCADLEMMPPRKQTGPAQSKQRNAPLRRKSEAGD